MRTLVFFLLVTGAWIPRTRAATVGLYADPNCASCDLQIPTGSAAFYVAVSGAPSAPEYCLGITLAEFRILGLPSGWSASLTPAPGASVVGSPFGTGVNFSFQYPQPGNCVLLYTGTLTPAEPGTAAVLRVTAHATPRDPSQTCPVLRPGNCGAPFCAEGGTFLVNSTTSCATGIAATTWERVKRLYH